MWQEEIDEPVQPEAPLLPPKRLKIPSKKALDLLAYNEAMGFIDSANESDVEISESDENLLKSIWSDSFPGRDPD